MKIHKKSWHYRLAIMGGLSRYDTSVDICAYMRSVGLGALFMCIGLLFILLFIAVVIESIAAVIVGGIFICNGFPGVGTTQEIAGAFLILVGGLAGIAMAILHAVTYIFNVSRRITAQVSKRSEPGFIRTAYLAWRDKHCTLCEIIADNK